ncbi:MAG: c-type cytochrome [Bryobacteraceae bacterium]
MKAKLCMAAGVLSFAAITIAEDTAIKRVPLRVTLVTSGEEMFKSYCASCHGERGMGDGPAAAHLKTAPAKLALLTRKNEGEFPAFRVMTVLGKLPGTGGAHGSTEMPVWGDVFRAADLREDVVQVRIYNLVRYVESLQEPWTGPKPEKSHATQPRTLYVTGVSASSGKAMFQAYCASCHGMDGRGKGPAAANLKTPPADLTQLARAHGGKYPETHVTTTLGQLQGAAHHGSKDMPLWGDVFRANHENESMVSMRIANLTRYVGTLQAR